MTRIASNIVLKKFTAIYMVVTLLLVNFPVTAFAEGLSVDLRVDGKKSLTLTDPTQSFEITLTTQNAVSCTQTSPINSGIGPTLSMTVSPSDGAYYPAVGESKTFTVSCTDANNVTVSDSVTVSLEPTPPAAVIENPTPTIDVKANGSDGPITINSGDSYTYTWNSTNATSCLQTSPINSGAALAGDSGPITSGSFYPGTTSPVTITITCTNGANSATDSVVINLTSVVIPPVTPGNVTIDVKANGSDGPITISSGSSYTYTWNSTGATSCLNTSPINSGAALAGDGGTVASTSGAYYPTTDHPVTITITCTNGTNSATDSVVINMASGPSTPATPTIDVKANSSDGPITINAGDSYTYTWNSTNATSCLQTSPINSGAALAGDSGPIASTSGAFYPSAGHPVTITITCANGANSATDSVVINLNGGTSNPGAVTVDVKANESDGPITINSGEPYTYTWNSTGATSCLSTSPINSGAALAGDSGPISSGIYYPTASSSVTITITCTNGTNSATDSVIVNLSNPVVTVDIKANGSDGPVTLINGEPYTYTWNSTHATSCVLTSPINSGISIAGTSGSITSGNTDFYPPAGGSKTLTITCVNQTSSATDSVVVNAGTQSCPVPEITSSLTTSVNEDTNFSYIITSSPSDAALSVGTLPSGLTFSTSTNVISGTLTNSGTYNITLTASNGCGSTTKTLAITVNSNGGGGGGGGDDDNDSNGGGGGGRRHRGGGGTVKGEEFQCLWLTDYMRRDFDNDPIQVMRLQAFLVGMEGHSEVSINGVFDQTTFDAVSAFQMKYKEDILTPWGHTGPTGYVYILTLKKVNELYCHNVFPLNEAQINEIAAFRALLEGLRAQGYNVDGYYDHFYPTKVSPGKTIVPDSTSTEATTTLDIPIVGKNIFKGQNLKNIAGAVFTLPQNWMEGLQCLYEFILILIVLYVLGSVLEDALTNKTGADVEKKFRNKWLSIVAGLVISIILAYIFDEWCLILPLIVALILSIIWIVIRPNHSSIKASFKSWYLVLMARSKSIANNAKNSAKANMEKIGDKKEELKNEIKEEKKEETTTLVKKEEPKTDNK